jgi:hypothetical protein
MAGNNSFKICLIILCLFVFTQKGKTQEFGISGLVYPSLAYNLVFEPGMNGGGVAVFFNRQKFKKLNLSLSGEYALSTWGNQGFLGIGINRTWLSLNRFELNTYGRFLNGLAFYKPKSLYVFGVDTRIAANFYLYKEIKLFCGVGIRYTFCPGYREYGLIETSLDIPIELGLKYTMK